MSILFLSNGGLGLGLKRNIDFNKALIAKLDWELAEEQDKLWIQIFRGKYLREDEEYLKTYHLDDDKYEINTREAEDEICSAEPNTVNLILNIHLLSQAAEDKMC